MSDREARTWTPEGRVVALDTALSNAESHLGQLLREAPWASRAIRAALKHVEIAAQVVGRDLAREMSLPSTRSASDSHLRSSLLRIAADLPVGDPTRREILAACGSSLTG